MKLNLQMFANMNVGDTYTSPVVNMREYGYTSEGYSMKFEVTLNSQNVTNFTSNITITSYMKTNANVWGWSSFSDIYMERYVKVNDEINYTLVNRTQLRTLPTNNAGVWVNCGSWTGDVTHNSQGDCTLYVNNHLLTANVSGYSYIPRDTNLESESLVLHKVHQGPTNVQYTITETNQDLIDAGVANNVFIKDLSIKSFNITCDPLYDGATVEAYFVFNYLNRYPAVPSATLPVVIDFSQNTLRYGDIEANKVPILVGILDNMGGEGRSGNFDSYDMIPYNKITITETDTTVKRKGQVSGRVNLNVNGNYYNGTIGNVDQGGTYKPTIKYKFWKSGDSEPSTYDYTVPSASVTTNNGTFSVYNYDIGSSTETDPNYFNPDYSYRIRVKVEDTFTKNVESEIKYVPVGEAVWTEYKDRVDFKKITVGGFNPFGYSTNETKIGVWIDGKPIYRKVYTVTRSSSTGPNWVDFDDIPTNIDKMIKMYGILIESSGNMKPSPHYENSNAFEQYIVRMDSQKLCYMSSYSNATSYVVLEYTKTTD